MNMFMIEFVMVAKCVNMNHLSVIIVVKVCLKKNADNIVSLDIITAPGVVNLNKERWDMMEFDVMKRC